MQQGTEEWFQARLGKVTASRVADVMSKGRGKAPSVTRHNYMMQLLTERLSGQAEDSYQTAAMQRGQELEAEARMAYWIVTGREVAECGLIPHSQIKNFGASPDGLVGNTGLIEIKCPNMKTHTEFLHGKDPDPKYVWQMQAQLACTGRKWCDFVSYDDRMREGLQIGILRVHRDVEAIEQMKVEVRKFLKELDALEKQAPKLKIIRCPINRAA